MRSGTDWQKLSHSLNNPEDDGQKKIVHDVKGYQLAANSYQIAVIGYRLSV